MSPSQSYRPWPPLPVPLATLQALAAAGRFDAQEWRVLYDAYDPFIRESLVARSIGGRRLAADDKDDLAQDVWFLVLRFIGQAQGEDTFPAWIRQVAYRVLISRWRAHADEETRARGAAVHAETEAALAPLLTATKERLHRREPLLDRLIETLSARDQDYVRRLLAGATHAELARQDGLSSASGSYQRRDRIVKRLRENAEQILGPGWRHYSEESTS